MSAPNYSSVADVVVALMHKPRTIAELCEFAGLHNDTVTRVLRNLHAAGVARRSGSVPKQCRPDGTLCTGKRPVVWALQDKPFALPDAVSRHGVPL